MIRTHKHRLYPTAEQEAAMSDILWVGCWLYNRALDYRRKRWYESRVSVSSYEQMAMWRDRQTLTWATRPCVVWEAPRFSGESRHRLHVDGLPVFYAELHT